MTPTAADSARASSLEVPDLAEPTGGPEGVAARTAHLAQVLGDVFNSFDTRMQALTADLDPENVRTAGAMALETGMYANNLAKILDDLIGVVHELTSGTPATPQPSSGRARADDTSEVPTS